jgi:hypothetical protein
MFFAAAQRWRAGRIAARLAGGPTVHALEESAVVLLLVESLLWRSRDASVAVTDATDASRVRVTLRLTVSVSSPIWGS